MVTQWDPHFWSSISACRSLFCSSKDRSLWLHMRSSPCALRGLHVWRNPKKGGHDSSINTYHLVMSNSNGKSPLLIGKPSINGPFSMAMLNNQRVILILVVPSGKRLHFAMERSTIFHGKILYFYGHFSLPEGNIKICWILYCWITRNYLT